MRRPRRLAEWLGRNWARLTYSRFVEPTWLETNQIAAPLAERLDWLDGLRILHLTDFHLGAHVPASLIRQAVEQGNRQQCDLVALTGDYIHAGYHHVDEIAKLLSRLKAPLGVFAVLGNHDYSVRNTAGIRRYPNLCATVSAALRGVGIDVLHNDHRTLPWNGAELAVVGVADLWSREAELAAALDRVPPGVPRIVLAHNPFMFEQLGGRRCDLMLSGHTHGGQVQVPGRGPLGLHPKMRDYAAGLIAQNNCHLYVNKGIGFTVRFRFQTRPEIAVLRLTAPTLP